MGTSRLGNLLVEEGLLSEADRRTIRNAAGHDGAAFARGLLALGLLDETDLAAFLADRTHHKIAPKDIVREIDDSALSVMDSPLLERLEVLPLRLQGGVLSVAMADPLDRETIRQVEFFTGYKVRPVIATFSQIREGLKKILPKYEARPTTFEKFLENHATSAFRHLKNISPQFDDPTEGRSGGTAASHSSFESASPASGFPPPPESAESLDDETDVLAGSNELDSDGLGSDDMSLEEDLTLSDDSASLESGGSDDGLLDDNLQESSGDLSGESLDGDLTDLGDGGLDEGGLDESLDGGLDEGGADESLEATSDLTPQGESDDLVMSEPEPPGIAPADDLENLGDLADMEAAPEPLAAADLQELQELAPNEDESAEVDPLGDLSDLEPSADLPLTQDAVVTAGTSNVDPLADLAGDDTDADMIATIAAFNRCFVTVSMAADRGSAASKAANFLSESGVNRGMIAVIKANEANWSGVWSSSPATDPLPPADALQIKAVTGKSWTRFKSGEWTPLTEALRSPDVDAAFHGWMSEGSILQVFKTTGMAPGEEVVFVGAWPPRLAQETSVLSAASELVRCMIAKPF